MSKVNKDLTKFVPFRLLDVFCSIFVSFFMSDLPESYEISAVSRLTGISPHVLRVWERRYNVVEPERTDSKRRRYSKENIRRLTLIKMLVDNGNSISSIAGLETSQLEQRVEEINSVVSETRNERLPQKHRKIAVVGTLVRDAVRRAVDSESALSIVGEFLKAGEVAETIRRGAVDLLVIEKPTVFAETVAEVKEAIETSGCLKAVVVYQYGAFEAIEALTIPEVTTVRFPATSSELLPIFLENLEKSPASIPPADIPVPEGEIPARHFSDIELAKISRQSSVVQCECPHHLSALLSNLGAFEKYSSECESRNEEDAELHNYLYRTSAHCRAEMEAALTKVLSHEGIDPKVL